MYAKKGQYVQTHKHKETYSTVSLSGLTYRSSSSQLKDFLNKELFRFLIGHKCKSICNTCSHSTSTESSPKSTETFMSVDVLSTTDNSTIFNKSSGRIATVSTNTKVALQFCLNDILGITSYPATEACQTTCKYYKELVRDFIST